MYLAKQKDNYWFAKSLKRFIIYRLDKPIGVISFCLAFVTFISSSVQDITKSD